jgi:hypothetical protein
MPFIKSKIRSRAFQDLLATKKTRTYSAFS